MRRTRRRTRRRRRRQRGGFFGALTEGFNKGLAAVGLKKKDEIPTEDKVAETFLAIKPDLPIPAQITFPRH